MSCPHQQHRAKVNVVADAGIAEVMVFCAQCGKAFRFVGLPDGMTAAGGFEALLPITAEDKSE